MALLNEALKEKELDIRMMNRASSKGQMGKSELDKASKKASDDTDNAEYVSIETFMDDLPSKVVRPMIGEKAPSSH